MPPVEVPNSCSFAPDIPLRRIANFKCKSAIKFPPGGFLMGGFQVANNRKKKKQKLINLIRKNSIIKLK